jgi:hypothetical protein
MRRLLPLVLLACSKREPPKEPPKPRENPKPVTEDPLTADDLRALGFPPEARVVKESHLEGERRYKVWAENHGVSLVLQWYFDDRYSARLEELKSTYRVEIEDRHAERSYKAVRVVENPEFGVIRSVEIGFRHGRVSGYVAAGNLEQDIPEADLEKIARRALVMLLARI